MAKLFLRFYGRFIAAVETKNGSPTGSITLLAPRFDVNKFRPHSTFLSVATMHVDAQNTSLPPTLMISSPQSPEAARAETVMWDLTDKSVSLPGNGSPGATLGVSPHSQDFPLLDLSSLVGLVQTAPAVLDRDALKVGPRTQAVVNVTQGVGVVHRALRPELTPNVGLRKIGDEGVLVTVEDARDKAGPADDKAFGGVDEDGQPAEIGMGEVIEFALPLETLTPFTLTIGDAYGKELGKIALRAIFDDQVLTASFSSLCANLPTNENYDLEFEQFYDALTPDTHPGAKALVPKPTDDGGEPASCQRSATIKFDAANG